MGGPYSSEMRAKIPSMPALTPEVVQSLICLVVVVVVRGKARVVCTQRAWDSQRTFGCSSLARPRARLLVVALIPSRSPFKLGFGPLIVGSEDGVFSRGGGDGAVISRIRDRASKIDPVQTVKIPFRCRIWPSSEKKVSR